MGPFDFLKGIKTGLQQYFYPSTNQVSSALQAFFPSKSMNYKLDSSAKAPDIGGLLSPVPQPAQPFESSPSSAPAAPTPQPQQQQVVRRVPTPEQFQQGFQNFSQTAPVATQSGLFTQAAQQLPQTVDPLLPAIMAIMETGGGAHTVAPNNYFNLRGVQNGDTRFVDYPSLETALLGGNNQGVNSQGFVGTLLNNAAYAPYRSSGNLEDFFTAYTPPGPEYGNPSMEELLSRYASIRQLFPEGL